MNSAALHRLVENLIRIGTIAAVDHGRALCKVKSGGLVTGWLPWATLRAGDTRTWNPPTVGEQVIILSPSGEVAAGVVLTGLFSTAHPAPSSSPDEHTTHYPDGTVVAYNHVSGALTATGIKTALVQASESVTLDTPTVHATGDLIVDGHLIYRNGISGVGGDHGNTITGPLTQTGGQLSSNGVVLDSHHHSGVTPGGSNTGGPA